MKKILLSLSALLLAVVIVVSCNKNSPKEVANTWLTNFYHMDYDAAKKVSTEDTKNLLAQLQQLSNMISDSSKKEQKKIVITIKDIKEEGDKASVSYTTSSDSPGSKDNILKLVKQNGQWLVQFSKNDSMGDMGGNGDQPSGADSMGAAPADTASAMADTSKH